MSIPINQKRLITIVEAEDYFSIGRKALRVFAAKHPELAFLHGNRWLIFREGMEKHLATYGLGTGKEAKKEDLDLDSDENDYFDWGSFYGE